MKQVHSRLWVMVALLQLLGCSSGSAQVTVLLRQGSAANNIAKVQVTVTAPGEDAVTSDLARDSSQWTGTISGLAEGTDRTFDAVAFDASGARLYKGQAPGAVIANGEDTLVFITLDELNASTAAQSEAPIITSLTAHPAQVRAGGTVTFGVKAMDRNPGDTVRLELSAPSGAFSAAANGTVIWTAPSSGADLTLACTAIDSQGLSSSISIPISVRDASTSSGSGGSGSACCRKCGAGSKPCGDSCIKSTYNCTKPRGCAC